MKQIILALAVLAAIAATGQQEGCSTDSQCFEQCVRDFAPRSMLPPDHRDYFDCESYIWGDIAQRMHDAQVGAD